MMNHTRQKIIDHLMNNKSEDLGDNTKEAFDNLVKPDKENMAK